MSLVSLFVKNLPLLLSTYRDKNPFEVGPASSTRTAMFGFTAPSFETPHSGPRFDRQD